MSATDPSDEIGAEAARLYAARSALAETGRAARRLGIAEIVAFLSGTRPSLTIEEQRSLFANPVLRADFRRLKAQLSIAELPALAAASTGSIDTRRFDGGTVSIHRSRVPDQVYMVLRFSSPAPTARALLLESAAGELIARSLPDPDGRGEIMLVLSEKNEPDRTLLRLVTDPTTTGSFLS
jgi:hypothetical protein